MSVLHHPVDTEFGKAEVVVMQCDECGTFSPVLRDTYYMLAGWTRITTPKQDKDGNFMERTKEERDFCSADCAVRHLAPGIYDTDPHKVTEAIEKLQTLEKALDAPRRGPFLRRSG